MGLVRYRALQVCFVGGSRRKVGDVFYAADGLSLRTKKRPPVLELVDGPEPEEEGPPPPPPKKKAKAAKKKAKAAAAPEPSPED